MTACAAAYWATCDMTNEHGKVLQWLALPLQATAFRLSTNKISTETTV